MKKFISILSLSTALGCVLLAGCSKAKDTAAEANRGTNKLVVGQTPQPAVSAPLEMKLKWAVGKRYVQEMTMVQNSEMTMPGSPQPMQQEMEMVQQFSLSALKELPQGGTELQMDFERQKMSSKMGGKEMMHFDTSDDKSKDAGNPMAPMLRKMVGAHVTLLTDANGNIEKVEGVQEFLNKVTAGTPPQSQGMIKSMFGEDTLKQLGSSVQLPDKPVKVGDTWPINKDVSMGPLSMSMKMKYKFEGWEDHGDRNCALLTYTGTGSSKPGLAPGGMTLSIENGKIEGKTWFDPAQGAVVENAADQTMTVKMNMQGKNMATQTKQKVVIKLVEVVDIKK